ncbi:MAG TPA: Crp/Fnr family transcriptional regulator [Gammaproteobacteria bacterium]|nr:Crp/Fnr family transcriptional regulator [Gammaproteobacteria bacterium]
MSKSFTDKSAPFADIQDDIGKNILKQARKTVIPANTIIFKQGDSCQNYFLVLEGSVKVLSRAENGREIVLYRVQRGQSCTLTVACLFANSKYPAEGITETEVKALLIPLAAFNQGLQHSADFRKQIFDSHSQRLSEIITLVEEISFGRIDARLAKALLHYIDTDTTVHITHQNLATELGSAREVISRQLKEFEHRGWVKLLRGNIEILDISALEQLASTNLV